MPRQHHYLKTESKYYQAIERGEKTFEVRVNDRDFKKYDILHLEESVDGKKTGRKLPPLTVTYILYGGQFGIQDGYCVMAFER